MIVEADHHMKRIGIGLEPGTDQVPSYLDRLVESGEIPEQNGCLALVVHAAPAGHPRMPARRTVCIWPHRRCRS